MRQNEETVIVGDRVVLVPYRKQHVSRACDWGWKAVFYCWVAHLLLTPPPSLDL